MTAFFIQQTINLNKMKYIVSILMLNVASMIFAQNLPKKSSKAEIEQIIGLTEVEISYSRPNVNGRTIFGDLVPYGEVWRLGANEATTIEFDYPISINGQSLDTGSYALFVVPEKNNWKIMVNSVSEQWGSNSYDASKDVLQLSAPVTTCDFTESFTIEFNNVNENGAVLTFKWETTQVNVSITTDTKKIVESNLNEAIQKGENLQKVYYNAADYALDNGDMTKAKDLIEKSLAIERSYYNVFFLAELTKETDVKTAKKLGQEAIDLAKKAQKDNWAGYIEKSISEW